jgi:hypothetical protein
MRSPPRPPSARVSIADPAPPWMFLAGSLATLLFVFYCFWPLTQFFFSQDDFHFLEKASLGLRSSMEQHFNTRPGHFRPLTKGLYFLVMWPLFGLNPIPYHIVSLVLHAGNAILAGVVLRRLGVSYVMSWLAALLFAANVNNLEAVAWISCVQQLLGATFAFVALIWGVDALATRSRSRVIGATIAYGLALASYEQTMAVPLVLIAWHGFRTGWRSALHACRGPLLAMLYLLFVYVAYVLGIRGLPEAGPYEMGIGGNIIENLRQYSGSVFAVWLIYPYVDLPVGIRGSHLVWCALIAWLAGREKWRELAFGAFTFIVFLAPVLFIQHHVFSFHLYIPAIAAVYLLAIAGDSLADALTTPVRRLVHVVGVCAIAMAAAGATMAVKSNITNYCSAEVRIPQVRVLRRAVLAERVCTDVTKRWAGGSRLALVYVGRQDVGNWGNIQSAIGDGKALRLVLNQPTLEVTLTLPDDSGDIPPEEMMIVTEFGDTFTLQQYQEIMERHKPRP